jgi:hypothetical protein
VAHVLGKAEVGSSILPGGTILSDSYVVGLIVDHVDKPKTGFVLASAHNARGLCIT